MATTRLMPLHVGKGRDVSTAIADIIDYVKNPQKTDYRKLCQNTDSLCGIPESRVQQKIPCGA